MAVNTKIIKNRIKSVKNTKKVTKAMEMVAAAKMKKAIQSALNTREYALLAADLAEDLAGSDKLRHPLFEQKDGNKLFIVLTSNRGLCGNFNSAILSKLTAILNENQTDTTKVFAIGKKGARFAKTHKVEIVSLYEKMSDNPNYEDVLPITDSILQSFLDNEYSEVHIVYTHFVSPLARNVISKKVLPITMETLDELSTDDQLIYDDSYRIYEPGEAMVLDYILPRLIEMIIFQALLESMASEHSSRMVAMKNSHEAAGDLIDDLTLEYNKARQAAITREISEIVAGADAQK